MLKWTNKKQNNIYNVAFFYKKIKKNTCRYHYQNLDDMTDIKIVLRTGHFSHT